MLSHAHNAALTELDWIDVTLPGAFKKEPEMLDTDPPTCPPHDDRPSDELVLAALERAREHRARATPAVPVWAIFEHLRIPRRSADARRVRIRLDVLNAAGWIERSRLHGMQAWTLTSAGSRHLRRERRAGRVPPLPESPQHSAWRGARTSAEQEIDRFRASLRMRLREASRLLDEDEPTSSDVWLALAEALHWESRRLGSAIYCLREWPEPDDAHPDVDERLEPGEQRLARDEQVRRRARRAGRRNIRRWRDGPDR